MRSCIAAAVIAVCATGSADAAVLFAFEETGGDVVGTLSGSADLTGLSFFFDGQVPGGYVDPELADLVSGPGALDVYAGMAGPAAFGAGGLTNASSSAGHAFGVLGATGFLGVPDGYASGATLDATTVFAGHTFASLGIMPGTYVYNWSSDSVTVRFGPAPIPLPAGLPLLAGGLGLLAWFRRR